MGLLIRRSKKQSRDRLSHCGEQTHDGPTHSNLGLSLHMKSRTMTSDCAHVSDQHTCALTQKSLLGIMMAPLLTRNSSPTSDPNSRTHRVRLDHPPDTIQHFRHSRIHSFWSSHIYTDNGPDSAPRANPGPEGQ